MKPKRQSHLRQRHRLELAFFMPQEVQQTDHYSWIDDLTNEEFAQMLAPSWAAMTARQRVLYPDLPDEEMDKLWGYSAEVHCDIA